jgi:anti-sigma factor RsiW
VTKLTDETLMAYADGQLDPSDRARVEMALAGDPESRARLEIFATTGKALAPLFQKPMLEPAPFKLVEFVLTHDAGANDAHNPPSRRKFLGSWGRFQKPPMPNVSNLRLAFALGATLIAGAGLGWHLHGHVYVDTEPMRALVQFANKNPTAQMPLQRVLETLPSGSETRIVAAWGEELKLKINLSYKNQDGDYCREYDVVTARGEAYVGAACRSGGTWMVKMYVRAAASRQTRGKMTPAGSRNLAIEAATGSMIEGDAFGRDEELALIRKGWQK